MGVLIVTVGISGSGKTTWCNKMPYKKISSDDCRLELTENINDMSKNRRVFALVDKKISEHAKNSIYNLIYDATNCNLAYLKIFLNRHKNEYSDINFVVFPCSVDDAHIRVCKRKNGADTPKSAIDAQAIGFSEVYEYLNEHYKEHLIKIKGGK